MKTHQIGPIVFGCVAAGMAVAAALVVGPLGGSQEHVITGAVLLAIGSSWALLARLSAAWAAPPQRWAFGLAGFMGLAGAGLLVFAPGDASMNALGWIWPPLLIALLAATAVRARRDLASRSRRWVVYPVLGFYALVAVGGGYETVRQSLDRRMYPAPDQLIDVGGYRLHLTCVGSGMPTVILESGLGETGSYWALIADAVGRDTRVCAYDRAGRGWSDSAPTAHDAVATATDLHRLLEAGHISGPFVLVGHSSGAQYVRVFASQHPEQVAGMVLVDGQPAEALERLPNFPAFYRSFRIVYALLPSLARVGVGRLVIATDEGLPAGTRKAERAHHSSAHYFRSVRDEFVELPASLAQARTFHTLGDKPLVIVTAAQDAQAGWLPLQEAMAGWSTNSSHRVVPYSHRALVTDPEAAGASIQAIRDVVQAVRFRTSLNRRDMVPHEGTL